MYKKLSCFNCHLSNEEKTEILDEINNYEDPRSSSIEALKIVQKYRGWISREAIFAIADLLKISESDLEEIATFYSQIFRQPVGRNIIKYCNSVVCYINGCEKIKKTLEQVLEIRVGGTTVDCRFTLLPICCLGNCDKSPTIMINDDVYFNVEPDMIINLLEVYP